MINHIQADSV